MTEPRQDDLAEACRRGDDRAYEELVRTFGRGMYHVVERILGNPDDAADVVQDTFLTAFRRIGSYRAEGSFRGWLYRIAIRNAFRVRRQRRPALSLDEEGAPPPRAPAERRIDRDLREAVQVEIGRLPEKARIVFTLHTIEGLTHAEIAGILDVNEGTSKSQLHYARSLLRKRLSRWSGDV